MAYNNLNFAIYSRTFGTLYYESKREQLPCSFFKTAGILKIFFEVGSTANGYQLTILDKHKNLIFWRHFMV